MLLWPQRRGQDGLRSQRRRSRSAAPPSPSGRRFHTTGEGVSAEVTAAGGTCYQAFGVRLIGAELINNDQCPICPDLPGQHCGAPEPLISFPAFLHFLYLPSSLPSCALPLALVSHLSYPVPGYATLPLPAALLATHLSPAHTKHFDGCVDLGVVSGDAGQIGKGHMAVYAVNSVCRSGLSTGGCSHGRDFHHADALSTSVSETPAKGRGGVSTMTVSPTARRVLRRAGSRARQRISRGRRRFPRRQRVTP